MLKDLARCLYAFYESNSMILKILDSAHQKTLWLCILSKKLRSEKEYNVIISLSMQRNRKQLFHAVHRPPEGVAGDSGPYCLRHHYFVILSRVPEK